MSTDIKRNYLTGSEMRTLQDMVLERKEAIERGAWNMTSFAEMAERHFKRAVTPANVKYAADAVSVQFTKKRGPDLKNMKEMRAAMKVMAKFIRTLSAEFNISVPSEVSALSEID